MCIGIRGARLSIRFFRSHYPRLIRQAPRKNGGTTFSSGECLRYEGHNVYCIIRVGIWRILPEWCLKTSKDDWSVITPEACEKAVGPDLWRAMWGEFWYLGFSIRELSPSGL